MGKLETSSHGRSRLHPSRTPFDPRSLANLWAWYDAADTATISTYTFGGYQISDKGPNGYNLAPLSGGPGSGGRTLNLQNVLDFNGSSNTLVNISVSLGMTAYTAFVVCQGDADHSDGRRILSLNAGSGSGYNTASGFIFDDSDTTRLFDFISNFGVNGFLGFSGAGATPADVYTLRKQGTGANQTTLYRGANAASTSQTNASTGTATSMFVGVGHNASTTVPDGIYFDGIVAEIIIYSAALSDADRDAVWSYLKGKWAV